MDSSDRKSRMTYTFGNGTTLPPKPTVDHVNGQLHAHLENEASPFSKAHDEGAGTNEFNFLVNKLLSTEDVTTLQKQLAQKAWDDTDSKEFQPSTVVNSVEEANKTSPAWKLPLYFHDVGVRSLTAARHGARVTEYGTTHSRPAQAATQAFLRRALASRSPSPSDTILNPRKQTRNGNGHKNPINREIQRLRDQQRLPWPEIARILNDERAKDPVAKHYMPELTTSAVYARYKRNAARIQKKGRPDNGNAGDPNVSVPVQDKDVGLVPAPASHDLQSAEQVPTATASQSVPNKPHNMSANALASAIVAAAMAAANPPNPSPAAPAPVIAPLTPQSDDHKASPDAPTTADGASGANPKTPLLSLRTAPTDPNPSVRFNPTQDRLILEAHQDVHTKLWVLVSTRVEQLGGPRLGPETCRKRFGEINGG
ncbi:MAG: hypothetical protein M1817_003262 [Caeruleum heppii]|nr:MAG: hypothetical protein M1817_003262 [Caeruleum heppii]